MSNIRIYDSDHFVNKHSRTRTNQIYKMRSTDLVPKFLLCHLLNKLRTVSVHLRGLGLLIYAVWVVAGTTSHMRWLWEVSLYLESATHKARKLEDIYPLPVLKVLKFYNQDHYIHHLNIIRVRIS